MKRSAAGILTVALLAFFAPAAQGQVALGPQLSLAEDVDFGIGVALTAPLTSFHPNLEFAGDFTLFFPDVVDYWEVDGAIRYLFGMQGQTNFAPFLLGGLTIGHTSWDDDDFPVGGDGSDTKLALRLGGGFKIPMERFVPFAELALGVGDLPDYTLRGGVTFPLGG